MKKIVAFDLDGTLSMSDRFLLPAYREASVKMGLPQKPDSEHLQMIGNTAEGNWKLIVPDSPFEEFRRFSGFVHEAVERTIKKVGAAYPHIPESLARLRGMGYHTVLCSNGNHQYVMKVLKALKIDHLIDAVPQTQRGWEKSRLMQEIISSMGAEKAVLVGDRHFDLEAARANEIPFIGCLYGLFPEEILTADIVVNDAAELPEAVESLIG